MNKSNQLTTKEQIKEINKSINYLTALNDHESLIMVNHDLKYYESLLNSIPASMIST